MTALTSHGQLYIKNNSDKPYKVSVAFFVTQFQFSGWLSSGWHELQPGEEKEVASTTPRERYLYYYAIGEQDTIKGHKKILVNPDLNEYYTVRHAIMKTTKEDYPILEWFPFKETRQSGLFLKKKKKVTIVLGD